MTTEHIALVEFCGSHDECLYTQMLAISSGNHKITWITNRVLYDRNPHLHPFCESVYFVEPQGKAWEDFQLMRKLVRYLKAKKITKMLFNTAQGGHIRNLALLIPNTITCYGIIHTLRKFEGSITQKIITRKVKKYLVLSDDLLAKISIPKGIIVQSFYPIAFPKASENSPSLFRKKEDSECWMTLTGGVENRRKDLSSVINLIEKTPPSVRFLFLGKTDKTHPDVALFLAEIKGKNYSDRIHYFENFVPNELFDTILRKTDFLLPLIHPDTPSAKEYINHQISGAFTISFGYKIPLLIHQHYATENDLQISSCFYTPETFERDFVDAIDKRTERIGAIENTIKWTLEYQTNNLLQFLEMG